MKAVYHLHLVGHALWAAASLIQVGIVVGNLLYYRAEVVAFRVVLVLVRSVRFYHQQSVGIVVCQSRCLPGQDVVTHMAPPPRYHRGLALYAWHQPPTVDNRHYGVVGRGAVAADVNGNNIPVGYFQDVVVVHRPHLHLAVAVGPELQRGFHYRGETLLAAYHNVCPLVTGGGVTSLESVYRIGVEYQPPGVSERLHLVDGGFAGHVSMGQELVPIIPVPIYRLEGRAQIPHSPKELPGLAVAGGVVVVLPVLP